MKRWATRPDKTNVKFDDFTAYRSTTRDSLTRGFIGLADASISAGTLLVTGSTRGGDAIVASFRGDDNYMVQVDADFNGGRTADIYVRYIDANNTYRIRLDSSFSPFYIYLHKIKDGKPTSLASASFTGSTVKIKVNGTSIKVWVDGTLKINTSDSVHSAGGVAFGSEQPKFDNLKIGYDNNADDDIDDAGDDVVVNEDFGGTSTTFTHDDNGNLTDDGVFKYTYDAWNRLVKVTASNDTDVTIQTAEYDGTGRRMKKVVTNSGALDDTVVYLYDGCP